MACNAEMTIREAEDFVASVPWRPVKMVPVGHGLTEEEAINRWGEYRHTTPDPHEYVIRGWREIDADSFDAFVRLINSEGYRATYRAPYRPDYEMRNHYLEIGGWCYWFIYPDMLNRERAEHRKHKPIPDPGTRSRCSWRGSTPHSVDEPHLGNWSARAEIHQEFLNVLQVQIPPGKDRQ